ncbi:uncharacterized protein LOC120290775 [Eucalyptus grandis]|uniref:uncharacterized protein LOC120290775 n=1 Tax=Eucalyptus grandis TaxID=71139 RepID=UPI00192EDB1B|nr:uncharacterized protein LOC120290775 [Eucalyptus grandis]
MAVLTLSAVPPPIATGGRADTFPPFLPKQVENFKNPYARKLASRIERLPVHNCIMSSCVKPLVKGETNPVVLLHGFDSSCLEWRYTYPLLEDAGLETWAVDILGWGFSDLEQLPACNVANKCNHFYQLWKSYIKKPMILVGPSLGAAIALDFAVIHPEAVIDQMRELFLKQVSILKSFPLRFWVNVLAFRGLPLSTNLDWTNVGRLHCRYPWWEDASVDFMLSGYS